MNKRERLEKTIAAEATDRSPVALWRHFPGDDLRAADHAQAVVDFQRQHDWDMVVVHLPTTYAVHDYNIVEQWHGSGDGARTITKHKVTRSLDWTELRALDPNKGSLGRQIECLRLVLEALPDVPIVVTLYSALDQAKALSGHDLLIRHLRTQPDRIKSGLNVLTENMLRFIDALRKLPLAGVCLVSGYANLAVCSEEEYRIFGYQYDRAMMTSLHQHWWLNMLRLDGDLPMFKLMTALPAQVIQWRDRDSEPDIAYGKSLCTGAVCCGLSAERDVYLGTPNTIRDAAREALQRANNRRLILSTGSPLQLATPLSNIRAVRQVVEGSTA
jgi:uroporphyrinogen decarboxylase